MTNTMPASFEPLASSNPVPADTDALTSLGQQYTATANEIEQQANTLQQLSNNSSDSWKSKAGSVFVSKASSLATRITQAQQRYTTAGAALTAAAEPMDQAQQQAYAAVQQAQEAQATMTANAPGPAPAKGSPPPTAEQKAAAATAASNYSQAEDSLSQARSTFNAAVDDYHTAASTAANAINKELGGDPLKDSWFQAHFQWLMNFFHILAIIVMALAAVALMIALPGVGALIDGIGLGALAGGFSTFVGVFGAAVGIGQTIFDAKAVSVGLGTWKTLAFDIVGDLTFGIGKGAEYLGSTIVKDATGAAEKAAGDAASQGAKDAFADTAKNDYMASRAGHNTWVADNPDAAGDGAFVFANTTYSGMKAGAQAAGEAAASSGAAAAAAKAAAAAASKAVGMVSEGAEGSNIVAAWSMSGDLAEDLGKLNAIGGLVPGVWKVGAGATALKGIAGIDGIFQLGAFGMAGYGISPAAG